MTALCSIPSKGAQSYPGWLEKAASLLSCPEDRVTIVSGSDLRDDDLLYAGAKSASSVLIFSPSVEDHADKTMADVSTILSAMRVQHVAPALFACVDLHEATNARFFRLAPERLEKVGHRQSLALRQPSNMEVNRADPGGEGSNAKDRVPSPMQAKVVKRAYKVGVASYKASVKVAFKNVKSFSPFVDLHGTKSRARSLDPYMNRMVAGGHSFSAVVLDRLLCRAYYNNHVIKVLHVIASPMPVEGGIEQSFRSGRAKRAGLSDRKNVLQLRPVPNNLARGSYGDLFVSLVQRQLLPLGLFRRRRDKNDHLVEYVFCNPKKSTPLIFGDRVYVIGAISTSHGPPGADR